MGESGRQVRRAGGRVGGIAPDETEDGDVHQAREELDS